MTYFEMSSKLNKVLFGGMACLGGSRQVECNEEEEATVECKEDEEATVEMLRAAASDGMFSNSLELGVGG
jgi:hypothetical protein